MLLCPDCGSKFLKNALICSECSYTIKKDDNVMVLLAKKDQEDPLFKSYLYNYEKISLDDLEENVLENRYLELQSKKVSKLLPCVEGKDICDVGSGRGFLLNELKKRNPKSLSAVDISVPYLKRMNEGIIAYQANAEKLPFEDQFDIITCTDVFEHVINVGSLVFSLRQALKPGGIVVIRVPYKENLISYASQNGCKYKFAHLRDFDKGSLSRLVSKNGFQVLSTSLDSVSLQIPQPWWTKTQKRMDVFSSLQSYARKFIKDDSDINMLNINWVRPFLRPLELILVARKLSS